MNKVAYSYCPDSGAYVGEVECQDDQLDFGKFLLPAHATWEAPKIVEGKTPHWNGSKWVNKTNETE